MIFSYHFKQYIFLFFLISLLELVKFTLSSDKDNLSRGDSKRTSGRKGHSPSRRKSDDRNSSTGDLSPGQIRRGEKLNRQLSVNSSKIIKDFYTSNTQQHTRNSQRKVSGFIRRFSSTGGSQKKRGSNRDSNPNVGHLSLPRQNSQQSQLFQRSGSLRNWKIFG